MGLIPVLCPHCQSDQVIKGGQTETGKQHYRCQQTDCSHHSFVLDPAYNGRLPYIKEQIIDMALSGSGSRDREHGDPGGNRKNPVNGLCYSSFPAG